MEDLQGKSFLPPPLKIEIEEESLRFSKPLDKTLIDELQFLLEMFLFTIGSVSFICNMHAIQYYHTLNKWNLTKLHHVT